MPQTRCPPDAREEGESSCTPSRLQGTPSTRAPNSNRPAIRSSLTQRDGGVQEVVRAARQQPGRPRQQAGARPAGIRPWSGAGGEGDAGAAAVHPRRRLLPLLLHTGGAASASITSRRNARPDRCPVCFTTRPASPARVQGEGSGSLRAGSSKLPLQKRQELLQAQAQAPFKQVAGGRRGMASGCMSQPAGLGHLFTPSISARPPPQGNPPSSLIRPPPPCPPCPQVAMLCFMMWMSGSTLHIFSIMMTLNGIYQPLSGGCAPRRAAPPVWRRPACCGRPCMAARAGQACMRHATLLPRSSRGSGFASL